MFLGDLLCPRQAVYTTAELQDHGFLNKDQNLVAIRGEVFDITQFAKIHSPAVISSRYVLALLVVLDIIKYSVTDKF